MDGNRETEIPGIFACGNVLHVHDLVDFVSEEAEIAGKAAAAFIFQGRQEKTLIPVKAGENVSYVLPQRVQAGKDVKLCFRVKQALRGALIRVEAGGSVKTYRRIAVAPGEMESVTVKADELSGAQNVMISMVREE